VTEKYHESRRTVDVPTEVYAPQHSIGFEEKIKSATGWQPDIFTFGMRYAAICFILPPPAPFPPDSP
jgi:hypothetical protein